MRAIHLLTAVAALAACSRTSADIYAEDYEAAVCEWAAECRVFSSEPQCREALILDEYPPLLYLRDAVAAGRVEFDARRARDCLAALASMPCAPDVLDGVLYQNDLSAEPEVCRGVFVGKAGNYAPCMHSAECAGDDAVCGFDPTCADACCVGGCRDRGAGPAEGESCTGRCATDLFCARDPSTFAFTVCEPLRADGEPCNFGDECAAGVFCDGTTCRNESAEGEACEWDDQCADGMLCVSGLCTAPGGEGEPCDPEDWRSCRRFDNTCDPASRRCVPLKAPGEVCEYDCVPYANCTWRGNSATCVALAGLGERCGELESGESIYWVDCLGHLRCDEGRCAEPELAAPCPVP